MKLDLKKSMPAYHARRASFALVTVPPMQYLMIDGHGDPNASPAFAEAVAAIYPVAYTLKFASRNDLGRDYVVMPLEALWSAPDMAVFTDARDKSRWDWTLMNMVPDWLNSEDFQAAVDAVAAKNCPAALDRLRLAVLDEGLCAQTLHVGPFDTEAAVLAELHDEFIPGHGLRMTGSHHEIYFSDFRRVPSSKLRTLLRQPVVDASGGRFVGISPSRTTVGPDERSAP
ncbi:MAG: GyrI-like domain-containing protein [Nakamurella sp.]